MTKALIEIVQLTSGASQSLNPAWFLSQWHQRLDNIKERHWPECRSYPKLLMTDPCGKDWPRRPPNDQASLGTYDYEDSFLSLLMIMMIHLIVRQKILFGSTIYFCICPPQDRLLKMQTSLTISYSHDRWLVLFPLLHFLGYHSMSLWLSMYYLLLLWRGS